jgi:hypothetical protein
MDEKRGWLEKVLDDATADVESWPNWLRDDEGQKCEPSTPPREAYDVHDDENPERRFARGA